MGNSEARGAKEGNYGGKIDRANSRLVWPHGLVSLRGGGNGRLAGRLGFSCRDDRFIHRRRTLAGPARSGSCSGTACASDPEGSTNCRQGFASGHYLGDFWCDRSHGARRRSVCLVVRPILGTGIWRAGTASIDMDKFPNAGRNSFAAPVVKIQESRGQTVITSGPYRHVRHPMYAGGLMFLVGTSLLLGSWWGLITMPILTLLLAVRIQIEENALRAGLKGYEDYARRVRYRLIPLIW
jgi:hypothetical protein